jgi:membrane protein required for colicin V production
VNQVDALLLVLLIPFALRGWFRGFCREGFGLVGIVGGVLAAAAGGHELGAAFIAQGLEPEWAALPLAMLLLFGCVSVAAALVGRLAERVAQFLFLGGLNRIGGVVVGAAKGAAVLAFGLLVLERASPPTRPAIAASRVGRPLVQLATDVLDRARALERERQAPAAGQEHV